MKLVAQLLTIARGGAREVAQGVIDANALRLLEQQLYECEATLDQARRDLTAVVAEKIAVRREVDRLTTAIAERESRARELLAQDDEAAALRLAERIATDEATLQRERAALAQLERHEHDVRGALAAALNQVKSQRRELGLLKATAHAQRASVNLEQRRYGLDERLNDIGCTTDRIRAMQQSTADRLNASREVERGLARDMGLDDPVPNGGAQTDAREVLNRLRAKQALA
ncbi:MAG: PspA/IM30 family protein [Chromatiales bacterium]|nr:PspA/IM30 family protein [Chromatiales bacterium]